MYDFRVARVPRFQLALYRHSARGDAARRVALGPLSSFVVAVAAAVLALAVTVLAVVLGYVVAGAIVAAIFVGLFVALFRGALGALRRR